MNDNEIKKELISLTYGEPYIFRGYKVEVDYLELAKELPEIFLVSNNAIFSWNMFKNFWESEIELGLSLGHKELDFSDCINSFQNKYHVGYPTLNALQLGLSQTKYLLDKGDDNFRNDDYSVVPFFYESIVNVDYCYPELTTELGIKYLFDKLNLIYSTKFNITLHHSYRSIYINNISHRPLLYLIAKALMSINNNQLTINNLMHYIQTRYKGINTSDNKYMYLDVIKSKPNFFKLFEDQFKFIEDYIQLNNFLDPVLQHFKENRIKLSEFDLNPFESKTGILAIIFRGKEFPLGVAKEFVKVRDIISLHSIDDISIDFNNFLKTILPLIAIVGKQVDMADQSEGEENYKNWLEENLLFSFYPIVNEIDFFKYCLTSKLTPVLELDEEFENIYRGDIMNLIKELNEKPKIENKSK